MKMPSSLSNKIEQAIAELVAEPVGHINYEGIRYQALPLFGTIGEVWLLRSDGSLWKADSDWGIPLQPLPENLHTLALVAGAERYPWLRELIPSRPLEADSCSDCGGLGRTGAGVVSLCPSCGGLGWRVAGKGDNEFPT
jgi:hypothetical protein